MGEAAEVLEERCGLVGGLVEARGLTGGLAARLLQTVDELVAGVVAHEARARVAAALSRALAAGVERRIGGGRADLIERIGKGSSAIRGVRRVLPGLLPGVRSGRRSGSSRGARDDREDGRATERPVQCRGDDGGAHAEAAYHAPVARPDRSLPRGTPALTALIVTALSSCSSEPEIRPQTVLVVDTDLPVAGAPGEVPVAAMDTLRIDVLDGAAVRETRELVLGDPLDWPVSLGAVGQARLRLRLFRATLATAFDVDGARVLEPRAQVTIDRLVDVGPPGSGVSRRRVLLTGECLGFAADVASAKTCTARDQRQGAPGEGIAADDGSPAHVGTWSRVNPAPCISPDDVARPCVPGSFDIIGDLALTANPSAKEAPVPLRAVVVSPFRMDRTEVTVGRFRALLAGGWTPRAPLPLTARADIRTLSLCTFVGEGDKSADTRPLNCLTLAFARELCAASKGRLPTEAEWEHAARGRDGRPFPWGFVAPSCCTTSASRSPEASVAATCPRGPVEPVGSHVAGCPGGGDVSRDGVLDLGGSLSELTSDDFVPVLDCGHLGLTVDPTCVVSGRGPVVAKSADWTSGLARTRSAFRGPATQSESSVEGFRCVYPEAAP